MHQEKNDPPALEGVYCQSCGTAHMAPTWACMQCGSEQIGSPTPFSGLASIESFTIVRRPSPGFPDAPYMIVVARLEEGVEILGWLLEYENAFAKIGDAIRFSHFDQRKIPLFRKPMIS